MSIPAICVAAIVACSSSARLTADQQRGQRIYESLCGRCHVLIEPKKLTDDQWDRASDKYGAVVKLQTNEIAYLKDYLKRANDSTY